MISREDIIGDLVTENNLEPNDHKSIQVRVKEMINKIDLLKTGLAQGLW